MVWGRATARAQAGAERRLAELAEQWRPRSDAVDIDGPAAHDDGHGTPTSGLALLPRGRSAARGLAVLVALAVAIAAYGVWMGRPRAVAEVPVILASGVPVVTGPAPAASGAWGRPEALPSSAAPPTDSNHGRTHPTPIST